MPATPKTEDPDQIRKVWTCTSILYGNARTGGDGEIDMWAHSKSSPLIEINTPFWYSLMYGLCLCVHTSVFIQTIRSMIEVHM